MRLYGTPISPFARKAMVIAHELGLKLEVLPRPENAEEFRRVNPLGKIPVLLRVDPDVLARFRASGPGWQTRMNAALRKAAGLPKDSPRARARKRGKIAG